MNGKARILTALNHREPDRVPIFEPWINNKIASRVLGRKVYIVGSGETTKKALIANKKGRDERKELIKQGVISSVELATKLNLDAVLIRLTDYLAAVYLAEIFGSNGIWDCVIKEIDENTWHVSSSNGKFWSVHRYDEESDQLFVMSDNIKEEGIAGLNKFVEYLESADTGMNEYMNDIIEGVKLAVELGNKYGIFIFGQADIVYPTFVSFHPVFMEAMVLEPGLINKYIERTTCGVITMLNAQLEEGVDGIMGSNDLCYNKGPLFSPQHFKRYLVPYMKEIIDICHKNGKPYIKHLDGNTTPILDQLIYDVGVDGYHSIEPTAGMDIRLIKNRYGNDITLLGNVDCAQLLVNGTKSEIQNVVKGLIRDIAQGGGYILSSSNSIHAGVPLENYEVMLNTAKSFGRYPIKIGESE